MQSLLSNDGSEVPRHKKLKKKHCSCKMKKPKRAGAGPNRLMVHNHLNEP